MFAKQVMKEHEDRAAEKSLQNGSGELPDREQFALALMHTCQLVCALAR